jgi:hypothetical protein
VRTAIKLRVYFPASDIRGVFYLGTWLLSVTTVWWMICGMLCESLIDGCLFVSSLGCSGCDSACKLVGDCGESSVLSGNNRKPLWFLLLSLVVAVLVAAANSSGRSIMIAGIKLMLLFTHTLLFWSFYTTLLTFLTGRDLPAFLFKSVNT